MITKVTVINERNKSLEIELGAPFKTGLLVSSIEGMGPPSATINTTKYATFDGEQFNSAKLAGRDIVMNFYLVPNDNNDSIEAIRHAAYEAFNIKKPVKIVFTTTEREVYVNGYVSAVEPKIFDSKETLGVTIKCVDPYVYDITGYKEVRFSGITPKFTFPFSNPVGSNTLVMGEINRYTSMVITYHGNIDTGVIFTFHCTANDVTGIRMYNFETYDSLIIDDDKLQVLTGSRLKTYDDIIITTTKGSRSVYLYRNGQYTDIINCINHDAKWFELSQGDNILAYSATTGITHLDCRCEFLTVYEGV